MTTKTKLKKILFLNKKPSLFKQKEDFSVENGVTRTFYLGYHEPEFTDSLTHIEKTYRTMQK